MRPPHGTDCPRILLTHPLLIAALCGFVFTATPSVIAQGSGLNPEQVVSAGNPTEPTIRVFHEGLIYFSYVEGDEVLLRRGPFVTLPAVSLSSGFAQSSPEISITLGAPLSVFYAQDDPAGAGSGVFFREGANGNFGASIELDPAPEIDRDPSVAIETGFGSADVVWVREGGGVATVRHRDLSGAVQTVGEGDSPDLASFDRTHHEVVYLRDGTVYHRSADLSVWGPELAISGALTATEPRVSTDDGGAVHAIFLVSGQVWYVRRPSGGGFTAPILVTPGVSDVGEAELVVDPSTGGVQIFFTSAGDLWRREGALGFFSPFENLTNTPSDPEDRIAAGVDVAGRAHLLYRRGTVLYYRNEVPPPVASFSVDVTSGEAPVEVQFTSTSEGVVNSWSWDFGDGNTSTAQAPIHIYDTPGAYDVTLTTTGPGGADSVTQNNIVQVFEPQNVMRIPPVNVFRSQTDVTLPVLATHPDPLQGYQIGMRWDPTIFLFQGADVIGTVTEPLTPDFIIINTHDGVDGTEALTMGVVFDTIPPADGRVIDPGEDQRILHVNFNIAGTAPIDEPSIIEFDSAIGDPPILNVFTVDGSSKLPFLEDGVITIEPFTFPPPILFRRGDYDSDGSIAINDGIALLAFLFTGGTPPPCMDAADVNDDGQVNISDPVAILNFLFAGGDAPAYPWPSVGSDPTEDALPPC